MKEIFLSPFERLLGQQIWPTARAASVEDWRTFGEWIEASLDLHYSDPSKKDSPLALLLHIILFSDSEIASPG
jgi:hypothetical protein